MIERCLACGSPLALPRAIYGEWCPWCAGLMERLQVRLLLGERATALLEGSRDGPLSATQAAILRERAESVAASEEVPARVALGLTKDARLAPPDFPVD